MRIHVDGIPQALFGQLCVKFNGLDISDICVGADDVNGWADVIKVKNENGYESIVTNEAGYPVGIITDETTGYPVREIIHGKIEIGLRDGAPEIAREVFEELRDQERMTTLGIAMLARNNAEDVLRVLAQFFAVSSDINRVSIVLGGRSSDNTAGVAYEWADFVTAYDGPLDDEGGLLDFARARQQSFDALDTDYALVVDTDDDWSGLENLGEVMREVTSGGYDCVMFPQNLGTHKALQTRLYKRQAGRWESPIHEHFTFTTTPRRLSINSIWIKQAKDKAGKMESVKRNIRLAEHHLKQRLDLRILYHVCREYNIVGEYDKAINACNAILGNLALDTAGELTIDKLFYVHWNKAFAHYCLEMIPEAIAAAMLALQHGPNVGDAWLQLSELSFHLGIYDLCLFAADKALALGNPIDTIPTSYGNVSHIPYLLKARALSATNRKHEALAAANLGLSLGGGDELSRLKYQLCTELGVIP